MQCISKNTACGDKATQRYQEYDFVCLIFLCQRAVSSQMASAGFVRLTWLCQWRIRQNCSSRICSLSSCWSPDPGPYTARSGRAPVSSCCCCCANRVRLALVLTGWNYIMVLLCRLRQIWFLLVAKYPFLSRGFSLVKLAVFCLLIATQFFFLDCVGFFLKWRSFCLS